MYNYGMISRRAEKQVTDLLRIFPATVLLGARQVGKTTLAKTIARQRASTFYDLENPLHCQALRADPVGQLCRHDGRLVVLDEVQKMPEIFEAIRSAIDQLNPNAAGKFLLLGSASGKLLRQSESLFGRVGRVELFGIDRLEAPEDLNRLWNRGGFPKSLLADDDSESLVIRRQMFDGNFSWVDTRASPESLIRLLMCLAHNQGGIINVRDIAGQLEVANNTIKRHLDMLAQMMLVRALPAFAKSGGQSLIKKPKYYIRDSGIVHSLLNIASIAASNVADNVRGASWEGFVIENILAVLPRLWQASFYRDRQGNEIDLILQKPDGCKASKDWSAKLSKSPVLKGFETAYLVTSRGCQTAFTSLSRHPQSSWFCSA